MNSEPTPFPAELQLLIDREMARGGYSSPTALLFEALQYWSEHRETVAALDEAVAEMEAGAGRPWEEVDRRFREQNGLPAKP